MSVKKTSFIILAILFLGLSGLYLFLETYDFNKFKPRIAQMVRESTGRELKIEGDLDLKLGYGLVIVARRVSLSNADWGSRPLMAEIERVEIRVTLFSLLRRYPAVGSLLLIKPDILIELHENGETNIPLMGNKGGDRSKEKPFRPPLQRIEIRGGKFIGQDCRRGKSYLMELDELIASARNVARPLELRLRGIYKEQPVRFTGHLGPLSSITSTTEKCVVDFELEYHDLKLTLQGTLIDVLSFKSMALELKLDGPELRSLGDLIDITMPFSGEFAVSGRITNPSPKAYQVSEFKLGLGENNLRGNISLDLSGRRPDLTADLTASKIDLIPVWPAENREKEKAGPQTGKIFSPEPLPLHFLEKLNGRIMLSIETLGTPFINARDIRLEAGLFHGHLRLEPLQASLAGGKLVAGLRIEPKKETIGMEIDLNLTDINLTKLQPAREDPGSLTGNMNVDLNLAGYGHSMASIMAGLSGGVDLRMNNGLIAKKYFQHLQVLGRDFATNVLRLINPVSEESEYTRIICSVCRLDIVDGISEITALVVNTPQMVVVGGGRIDLMTEKLDISLKPSPKEGFGLKGLPRISLSFSELTRPFKLGGTLTAPSLSLDPTQTALTIGKALGGSVLFGPVGIAAALLGGVVDGEDDPCLAAIQAAEKAAYLTKEEQQKPERRILEKAGEKIKGFFKGRRE